MHQELLTLDGLIEHIAVLQKLYAGIRVVDPFTKKVLFVSEGSVALTETACYRLWKQGEVCTNCIAVRAVNENDSFLKFEYNEDKVYMVTATPIRVGRDIKVLELLKDITNAGIVFGLNQDAGNISDLLRSMNDAIVKDALTGVYNRRFINERLPADIVHSVISKEPISLIMLDIDNFKCLNDTYRHTGGDIVLKAFSKVLLQCVRSGADWVARYGGDEFLICLTKADRESAVSVAQCIQENLERLHIPIGCNQVQITVSQGVCTCADGYISAEDLTDYADQNLYEAKRLGRNRIVDTIIASKYQKDSCQALA